MAIGYFLLVNALIFMFRPGNAEYDHNKLTGILNKQILQEHSPLNISVLRDFMTAVVFDTRGVGGKACDPCSEILTSAFFEGEMKTRDVCPSMQPLSAHLYLTDALVSEFGVGLVPKNCTDGKEHNSSDFEARFTLVDHYNCYAETFLAESGLVFFSSPLQAKFRQSFCEWHINVAIGHTVLIEILYAELKNNKQGNHTFITISDDDAEHPFLLVGTGVQENEYVFPIQARSLDYSVVIKIKNVDEHANSSFVLFYDTAPEFGVSSPSGEISHLDVDSAEFENCTWKLKAPPGNAIFVNTTAACVTTDTNAKLHISSHQDDIKECPVTRDHVISPENTMTITWSPVGSGIISEFCLEYAVAQEGGETPSLYSETATTVTAAVENSDVSVLRTCFKREKMSDAVVHDGPKQVGVYDVAYGSGGCCARFTYIIIPLHLILIAINIANRCQ